jgi:putative Holliday junction resolvase
VLEPALQQALPQASIHLWDERFSTSAAERTLLEADLSRAKRKKKIDAMAAQFILQGWLDSQPQHTGEPEA